MQQIDDREQRVGSTPAATGLMADTDEAIRQLGICNSCRYCEGYCSTFQSLTRHRSLSGETVSHLANLCHNCRGCYYACQYTEPHEFAINIPALLANIRAQSWEQHMWPQSLTRSMQRSVWPYVALTLLFTVLFTLVFGIPWLSAQPFYSAISHSALVALFSPLFLIPFGSAIFGIRSYWKAIGGSSLRPTDLIDAVRSAAALRQLDGGNGQGCNYESADRYTMTRRWAHQATMYGFLLCFLSTSTATVYHYLLDVPAPYPLMSLPKMLGVIGGLLLVVGCGKLLYLKTKADPSLGSGRRLNAEYAFIALLLLVGLSGLLLYWSSGTVLAGAWLILHLALVATFFIAIPYSKMTHGFFRLAALCREAQLNRKD